MKSISKLKYLVLLTSVLLTGLLESSCKKLIEIPSNPPSQITSAQLFTDSTNIMAAVAGSYNAIGAANQNSGIGTKLAILSGLSSDELLTGQYSDEETIQFLNNSITRNNASIYSTWTSTYSNIYLVNACLEGIKPSSAITNRFKQQLTGELKVIRALHYLTLVNLFGGVPIVLSTDYKTTARLPRASVDEVYTQIINDLTEAEAGLTTAYPSIARARVNVFVAKALLAKVYLYRGNWQRAEDLSTQVINAGIYTLEPELNNVFLAGSSEAIWQLPANGMNNQTSDASNFVPYSNDTPPNNPVSGNLLNAFEAGDQRLAKWISFNEYDPDGSGTLVKAYFPFKYKNRDPASPTTEAYMVCRLSEQFLIRSEARAQSGNIGGSVSDMNLIRTRARANPAALPDYSPGITQEACLTAILHERQTELFCEWGNRWFDLKRSGKINTILGAEKPSWKATAALYPVPQSQMQLNPFLTQNPGY